MRHLVKIIDDVHWLFSRMLLAICKLTFSRRLPVSPTTIVVLRHCFFGDYVVAIPALRMLRSAFPYARIVLLTTASFAVSWRDRQQDKSVFDIEPGLIDEVVIYSSKDLLNKTNRVALRARIGYVGQAVSVSLCYSAEGLRARLKRVLLFHLLRMPIPLGLTGTRTLPMQHVLNRWRVARSDVVHQIDAAIGSVNELLSTVGCKALPLDIVSLQKVRAIHSAPILIGVAPFSKQGVKQWPLERFAEVIIQLAQEMDVRFEIYGAPTEREMALKLDGMLQGCVSVSTLCGELTPAQLRQRLESVELLICLDSGPMHVASLVGTPLVSIFSQVTLHQFWRPWGTNGSLVSTNVPCAQCNTQNGTCPLGTRDCIEGISINAVLKEVRLVLASIKAIA
jgi:ADP-heptose:LPS heptosyltransferase